MARTTRKDRREIRKESLKQAGIKIFSSHGYHSAKVSQIVQEVGVAQGTFYLYFKSKEELFGELLNDFLDGVLDCISAWDPSSLKDVESLKASVFKIGLNLTALFVDNQDLTTIFFREGLGVNEEFNTMIGKFYEKVASLICRFNLILHRRGFIPKMNFELTAWIIIGATERVVREYMATDRLSEVPPQEIVEHLLLFYIQGASDPIPTTLND